MSKRRLQIIFFPVMILLVVYFLKDTALSPIALYENHIQKNDQSTQSRFDKTKYSLSSPNSLWVVVNKKRPLPASFVPNNLVILASGEQFRNNATNPLGTLLANANSSDIGLKIISGFRSYDAQSSLYSTYVAQDGQASADTYSARAGHSEHQTGLAVDLGNTSGECDLDACFADTGGGEWLMENAQEYGFIIRYLNGEENITGYQYEPWHLRYVGVNLAKELVRSGQTMEKFFGLPPAPNY